MQEPKENANEAAIKVWEEKKKKTNKSLSRGHLANLSPIDLTVSRCESRSESPGPIFAESRIEPPQSDDRSQSPLFVPVDEDLGSPRLGEITSSAQTEQDQAPSFSQELKGFGPGTTKVTTHRPRLAVTTPNHSGFVFEYITRSSIPSRYRLPGEITEPNSPVESKEALSVIRATQTPSQALPGNRNKPVDEIAETPPSLINIPKSQSTRITLGTKSSGSQTSIIAISQKSNSSSLGSQFLSGTSWTAGC